MLSKALQGTTAGVNPNAWDLAYASYNVGSEAWDISSGAYSGQVLTVTTNAPNPRGLFFKPDGTKMYIGSYNNATIVEYDCSIPWLATSATYVQDFNVGTGTGNEPHQIFFKPDGTKMYYVGLATDEVHEYSLSTAWNISTASFVQDFSVATQEISPTGLFFKSDGTKMYVCGATGDDVNEYNLSTAWDISTATYLQNFSVSSQDAAPRSLYFKSDGTKMYISGTGSTSVYEYNLSTAWDVSTASYVQSLSVSGRTTSGYAFYMKDDGDAFYIGNTAQSQINQFVLGGFSIASQESNGRGLFFKPDGTKMYVVGSANSTVYQYDLSTAFDIYTASYIQGFSVAAQETGCSSLYFDSSGTRMYFVGVTTADAVYQYSLSTAWDISTASYIGSKSVGSQDSNSEGLFFKPDGTKMYTCGSTNDRVYEYSLSTAWDISTASFVQNFSVATEETGPTGVFFKTDGTVMYVIGSSGDDINEYSLSTAWNISTATYVQNFSVASQGNTPRQVYFKDDGLQFFHLDQQVDKVFSYLIS